jgi:hypothetical protein
VNNVAGFVAIQRVLATFASSAFVVLLPSDSYSTEVSGTVQTSALSMTDYLLDSVLEIAELQTPRAGWQESWNKFLWAQQH